MFEGTIPADHQENAERVRAYLVTVRGGAPFLSGADCRLLVSWLDSAVPIPALLVAIDRVSMRRRAKRVRSRMSLTVCKGELNKLLRKVEAQAQAPTRATVAPEESPQPPHSGLNDWLSTLRDLPTTSSHYQAQQDFANALDCCLGGQGQHQQDQLTKDLLELVTGFHKNLWEATIEEHEQLCQQAELELESIKPLLPPHRWGEALEEVMRDSLRARCPLISAQHMWNALNETC